MERDFTFNQTSFNFFWKFRLKTCDDGEWDRRQQRIVNFFNEFVFAAVDSPCQCFVSLCNFFYHNVLLYHYETFVSLYTFCIINVLYHSVTFVS